MTSAASFEIVLKALDILTVAAYSRGLGPPRSSVQQLRLDNGREELTSDLLRSPDVQQDPAERSCGLTCLFIYVL